uniref:CAP10 domain-containing protein n=1 Tax=Echinostoma caproni TaxID=27848 RepID=A0A183ANS5_9TREM
LPAGQNGPFRGVDIEVATEQEYNNGFDCIPVGWREVIPEETGLKDASSTSSVVRRSVDSGIWDRSGNTESPGVRPSDEVDIGLHMPTEYGPNGLPETVLNSITEDPGKLDQLRPISELFVENHTVPGYRSVSHLLPLEPSDMPILASLLSRSTDKSSPVYYGPRNREVPSDADNQTEWEKPLRREKRDWDVPFYTVGEGTVFNSDRFFEVHRLIAHAKKVTSKNCDLMTADQLEFPGEVSYGAEKQFEMVGRTALRLSHFLSAYYQNNVVGEVYGSLLMFTDHDGVTWDLFAPYAYKPVGSTQAVEAIDMSVNTFRDYVEKPWFRTLKIGEQTDRLKKWMHTREHITEGILDASLACVHYQSCAT